MLARSPLPRVAFHLACVIHRSFSRWDRDSCVADTSPLCFLFLLGDVFFLISLSLPSSLSCFTFVCSSNVVFLSPSIFKNHELHIFKQFSMHGSYLPHRVETHSLGRTYAAKFVTPQSCTWEGMVFEVRFY